MKYKAFFSFMPSEATIESARANLHLPVTAIMVDGGTSRMIKLNSLDDISLVSELEQARTYKNLIVYLAGTKDHRDMKAALDLTAIAGNQELIKAMVTIERRQNGKLLDALAIYDRYTLSTNPVPAIGNTMMISLKMEEAEIFQGPVKGHMITKMTNEL